MTLLAGILLALVGAGLCLWSPVAALPLVLVALLYLARRLHLDTKPLMLVAGPLQRSCFAYSGYAAAVSATLLAGAGLRPGNRRLGWPGTLVLGLAAYTLLSVYLRAVVEQGRLVANPLASDGPTFYKYMAHALTLYAVLALGLRSRHEARHAVYGYLAAMVAVSLLALYQWLHGDNDLLRRYWSGKAPLSLLQPVFGRSTGVFYDSNHLGNFLAVGILLALGQLLGRRGALRRLAFAAAAALGGAALFCSSSLSNWCGLAIGLLIFVSLRRGWPHLTAVVALVLLACASFGVQEAVRPQLAPPLVTKVESLMRLDLSPEGPLGIRTVLAGTALRLFASSPVVGVGYGAFQALVARDETVMRLTRNITYSHNSFLLVLVELGVLGLLLLLALLGTHLGVLSRLARSRDPEYRAMGASLVAALCACLIFEATYDSLLYDVPLWTVLGLGVGVWRLRGASA